MQIPLVWTWQTCREKRRNIIKHINQWCIFIKTHATKFFKVWNGLHLCLQIHAISPVVPHMVGKNHSCLYCHGDVVLKKNEMYSYDDFKEWMMINDCILPPCGEIPQIDTHWCMYAFLSGHFNQYSLSKLLLLKYIIIYIKIIPCSVIMGIEPWKL